jgi:putative Mg2+ transporter-C (MgtC) family protein
MSEPPEAIYTIHVVRDHEAVSDARNLLFAQLEAANYLIYGIETLSEGDNKVELAAILVSTTAENSMRLLLRSSDRR